MWCFSGPYFPAFGLNTPCGKILTRKIPNTDTFHVVEVAVVSELSLLSIFVLRRQHNIKKFMIIMMKNSLVSMLFALTSPLSLQNLKNKNFSFIAVESVKRWFLPSQVRACLHRAKSNNLKIIFLPLLKEGEYEIILFTESHIQKMLYEPGHIMLYKPGHIKPSHIFPHQINAEQTMEGEQDLAVRELLIVSQAFIF